MTAVVPLSPSTTLPAAADLAHHCACAALDGSDRQLLDAVGWLAAHLVAVERAVHPVARRVLGDDGTVPVQRRVAHDLEHVLWLLDRRLTGDTRTSRLDVDALVARARDLLDAHTDGEQQLLAALGAALAPDEARALAAAYDAALRHAPSRPHPFNPAGRGRRLALRVEAVVDRVRDLMDGRRAPHRVPPRPPRAPGRWGLYLLGTGSVAVPEPAAATVTSLGTRTGRLPEESRPVARCG